MDLMRQQENERLRAALDAQSSVVDEAIVRNEEATTLDKDSVPYRAYPLLKGILAGQKAMLQRLRDAMVADT